MTTQEVAQQLVSQCSKGQFAEAMKGLYSPDILSVEAAAMPGASRESKGLEAVLAKGEWWMQNHEVHSTTVEGPLVSGSHFCVRFKMDVTFKQTGKRMDMDELAVYQVANGKIVREEFFYSV